jgi:hypothetical protein
MLVVRVTKNVRAVQSSYYSSCPWCTPPGRAEESTHVCDFARACENAVQSLYTAAILGAQKVLYELHGTYRVP